MRCSPPCQLPPSPISLRLARIPEQYLIGTGTWAQPAVLVLASCCVLAGALSLLRWGARPERDGSRVAIGVALGMLVPPLLLAAAGLDYVIGRNAIGALLP